MNEFRVVAPLTYGGKKDCTNAMCRRMFKVLDDGSVETGECLGWHCSYCDEPTSFMGHNCDAAEAIVGEAKRIAAEDA